MATYLFTSITQFKEFVGGGVNVSLSLDSIAPTMYMAAQEHLLPWLGETTWADLVDAVENNTATADELALLPYVRRPLALLTMYEYTKIGSVQFSEAGMFRTESEDMGMKSPYKYQENEYKNYMRRNGYEALELLLLFLDDRADTYTAWAAEVMPGHRSLMINYARDFRAVYGKYVDRFTFEVIRPIIQDIETFAIRSTLGDAQYERLKAGILADDLTGPERTLLAFIRRAIANWTIEEGIQRSWIQLLAARVVQVENLEPQSFQKDSPAGSQAVSLRLRHESEFANRHLSYVTRFLSENLDDYPLYSAYLDELAAAAAEAETDITNTAGYRAFPYQCCSAFPSCSCSSTSTRKKGLFRF